MMTEEIDALDASLREAGMDITLRRQAGSPTSLVNIDVDVRAAVRSPTAEELIGGYKQTDSVVIMSPSEISRAQWPGGQPVGTVHPEIPAEGDKVVISGRVRNVEAVNPFWVNNILVRIELRVKGGG